MRGPAFFAYANNYLIDVKFGVIVGILLKLCDRTSVTSWGERTWRTPNISYREMFVRVCLTASTIYPANMFACSLKMFVFAKNVRLSAPTEDRDGSPHPVIVAPWFGA
jgi:hypothetical protein